MKSKLNESGRADLRRVLAQMESSAPMAPDLETPTTVTNPVRHRSTAVNALAGVAVVTALILPAAFFFGGSTPDEPIRVPVGAEPPIEPSTTVGTTATTAVQAVEWAMTELPSPVDVVTVHEGRFFAISADAVLASDDGVEWSEVGRLPAPSWVTQLLSHDGLLVAEGSEITEDSDAGRELIPTVWVSSDGGATWSPTLVGEMVVRVASTPVGLIAAGFVRTEPLGDQLPRQAAVWTSEDGYDWSLAWQAEGEVGVSTVADAAIWDDGLVVLGQQGGHTYNEGSGKSNEPWERVAWTGPSPSELSASGSTDILGYFQDLKGSGSGLLALTYSVDPTVKDSSAVWRSDDGIEWTQVDVGAGWYHTAIATEGSMIVIGGDTLGYATEVEKRIWISTDGTNWHDFDTSALPEGVRVGSVALHHGVLVVALYSNDEVGAYLVSTRISP